MTIWRIVHRGHRIELFFERAKGALAGDYALILKDRSDHITDVGICLEDGKEYTFPINRRKYDVNYAVWSLSARKKLTIFVPEVGKENVLPKGKSVKYTISKKKRKGE